MEKQKHIQQMATNDAGQTGYPHVEEYNKYINIHHLVQIQVYQELQHKTRYTKPNRGESGKKP